MAPVVRRAFLLVAATWVLVGAGTASAASMGPMGPRVINGSNAVAGAWPGIVYLQYTPSAVPNGIAVDAAGNVFTADYAAGAVSKITPGTTPTVDIGWAMPGGKPLAIAIDTNVTGDPADDVVYVTNATNTVTAFDSAGTALWTAATGATPIGTALDASGSVYTANYSEGTVTRITPSGVASEFATTGLGPHAVAVDADGNVYTANRVAGTVTKFNAAGAPQWTVSTGAGPSGIAIDAKGAGTADDVIYTANTADGTVTKITSGGVVTDPFATIGTGPAAIAVDAAGNVYTANANASNVTKITSGGTVTHPYKTTGTGPVAIAVDATGILYTADQAGSTVTKIAADGTRTLDWAVLEAFSANCTGSVIAPAVILTAAHCTVDALKIPAIAGVARPGVIAASDTDTQRSWHVAELLPHPGYDPVTLQNDVALVVLERSTGAPAMPVIAPWQDGLVVGGAAVDMAGWGKMAPGGISPTTELQEATVPLISNAACERGFESTELAALFTPASMLCAYDGPAGIGVCQGDSGGPLSLTVAGTRTLIGVTSWVQMPCASGPSVYNRLSAFRSWILDDQSIASELVRDHLTRQNAAARNLELRSTGSDVTLTWGVTPANWTTTGFRVTINGSAETVTGPTTARTVSVPAGGTVTATVLPEVTLGTATAATLAATPTPTRAPVVTASDPAAPRAGRRLTVTAASDDPWGGAPAYQWLIDGAAIPGATSATYRPLARQAGQRLSVRITATNAAGTGTATVAAGRVRQAPQVATGPVAVTGTARVGGRLRARPAIATGFPQPTATYRWFRDGRRIPGATGAAYRVRPADAGAVITGRVTWTNATGTAIRMLRPTTIAP